MTLNYKIIKYFYIFLIALFITLIPAQLVLALDPVIPDTTPTDTTTTDDGGFGLGETANQTKLPKLSVPQFLGQIAGAALALAGSAFLFLIIYGGMMIMTAAGNKEKVDKGKNIIVWAIIGALILFSAYAITNLIFNMFTASST